MDKLIWTILSIAILVGNAYAQPKTSRPVHYLVGQVAEMKSVTEIVVVGVRNYNKGRYRIIIPGVIASTDDQVHKKNMEQLADYLEGKHVRVNLDRSTSNMNAFEGRIQIRSAAEEPWRQLDTYMIEQGLAQIDTNQKTTRYLLLKQERAKKAGLGMWAELFYPKDVMLGDVIKHQNKHNKVGG